MTGVLSQDIISIIVPIYNVEDYVEQCIESVINQSYQNLEVILVDDGSTDRSGEICDKYVQIDSRIKVIHKKNGGLVDARCTGLHAATGKYIGFVDGDDYIETDMYQTLYEIIEKYQTEFVHSGYYSDDKNDIQCTFEEVVHYQKIKEREFLLGEVLSIYPDSKIGSALWVNLFERKFIVDIYNKVPISQSYGEDLITMCLSFIYTNNFVSIPEAFYHYRIRKDSISKSVSKYRLLDYYNLYSLLEKNLLEQGFPDIIKILKKRFTTLAIQTLAEWNDFYIPKYKYPNIDELKGKKIVLYGSGVIGRAFYHQISKYQECKIINWIDQKEYYLEYARIESVESIIFQDYDIIVIAVYKKETADEIIHNLISLGINRKIIIWKKAVGILD